MKSLPTIGKYLLVVPMLGFAIGHFTKAKAMAGMVPIPGGEIWVYLTGVFILAGVIGILINKKAKLAAQLFGLMVLLFALLIWLPSLMGGNEQAMGTLIKDLSIAGGFWYLSKDLSN